MKTFKLKSFQHLSVKNKLTLIILIVTFFTIISGFVYVIYDNIESFKKDMLNNAGSIAELVSEHCASSMEFQDTEQVQSYLDLLSREKHFISTAVVYDRNGDVFVQYKKDSQEIIEPKAPKEDNVTEFKDDYFYATQPIFFDGKKVGTLYLKASSMLRNQKIKHNLQTLSLLIIVLSVISFFLARRLQTIISGPILKLARVMRTVAEEKDFSLRIEKKSDDEIGVLYEEFNYMLQQVQLHREERDRAETKYRDIFENAAYGIFQTDSTGRLLTANPAYAQLLGYDSVNDALTHLTHCDDQLFVEPKQIAAFREKMNANGAVKDFEFTAFRKDGSIIYLSQSTRAVTNKDKHLLYYEGILEDISQKKHLEILQDELRIAKEAAEAASKAKSEFLANMSHEIRTPMNAILGFAELLDDEVTDEVQRDYVSTIFNSGNTLLRLINDILDLSKIEAGKFEIKKEPVVIRDLINEIQYIFSEEAKKRRLDFYLEIDESLPEEIIMDEVRLRQILINLLGNALKFTKLGFIKLAVASIPYETSDALIDLVISVEDSGIGIPADRKYVIFEAFRQLDVKMTTKYGGTGLGLSITKHLVEMMGGDIFVDSEVGKGSVFKVVFNHVGLTSGHEHELLNIEKSRSRKESISIHFDNASILVVDDIESNRSLLKGYLKLPGLSVIEAENGKEALDYIKMNAPDLIIMDLRMPVMDGYEAIRIIKDDPQYKHIPVIALSASAMKGDEEIVKQTDCNFYLRKPITRPELLRHIKMFLRYTENKALPEQNQEPPVSQPVHPVSQEIKNRLPELIAVLDTQFMTQYSRIQKRFIIDEVESFAIEIKKVGEHFKFDVLTNWANQICQLVQNFEIARISEAIKDFPHLVDELKRQAN